MATAPVDQSKADEGNKVAVTLTLLGKEYKVACPDGEQAGLEQAATMLDARMRAIRESARNVGAERLAVISALNLVHELNQGMTSMATRNDEEQARTRGFLERLDEKMTAAVNT